MGQAGWVAAEWGTSPTGRRAKFYRLTPTGKQQLATESEEWSAYVLAIARVMRATSQPA